MRKRFNEFCRACAEAAGSPFALLAAVLLVAIWAAFGPVYGWSDSHSLFVNSSTTIITFWMVFILQNSQNRDGEVLQAKLDASLRMQSQILTILGRLEKNFAETEEEMEGMREEQEEMREEQEELHREVRRLLTLRKSSR